MITRRSFSNSVSSALARWLMMLVIAAGALPVRGQTITELISFTNVWKYDRSGLELGAAWRTNDFDDSAWESGRGLIGYEDPPGLLLYQVHVPTGLRTAILPSSNVITFYFRTTFQFSGATNFVHLVATNLVDDGCAIWLNGQLAGTVRLNSNGNFTAATLAQNTPVEGQLDVVGLRDFLREGENQLAVEVHQASAASADIMFGMRLLAFTPTPLVITKQPEGTNVTVGDPITLRVGVAGGPASYRWQKDGVFIANATNSAFTLTSALPGNSGDYRVICSNVLGAVTSEVVRLIVAADLTGPKAISAIEDNGFGANRILVNFSEPLASTLQPTVPNSPLNLTNYSVTRLATGQPVEITSVQRSGSRVVLSLNAADPDWVRLDDYFVTINNVADRFTNSIAPGTRVPILWNYTTNLVQASHAWEFHDSAIFDPEVFAEDWIACDYQPGPWWGSGIAPFYGVFSPVSFCTTLGTPQTPLGWQPEPMLFRTTFNYPVHWPSAATLRLRLGMDDGLILFLNGQEIYRTNVLGTSDASVGIATRAVKTTAVPVCIGTVSIEIPNFLPGTNCFAVALLQPVTSDDNDLYFVMDADAVAPLGPELPATPTPELLATQVNANNLRLSWNGGGYVLESSTNLGSGPSSYPYGPWTPVPQLANPYLWPLTNGETTFFRLKK